MRQTEQTQAGWQVPFFTIWSGQALSLLGSMLVQFALVWWLTDTTGSATVLASASLTALLPRVFLGPFTGALVDRWDRRRILLVADGIIALAVVGMAYLFYVGAARPWHVYVVMFIRSAGGGFHWPAMQASTSLMVPEEHLSRVAGLNQTLHGGASIVAPPLGALLLGLLPLQGVLAIDVGTAFFAIVPLLFIAIPQPKRAPSVEGRVTSVLEDVREGFGYVWSWPGLLAIGVMAMLINFLFNPALSLLPILVTKHFEGGVLELGWIESAWGVGMVLGGLILSVWGGFDRRVVTSMMGLIGIGLGFFLLGVTPSSAFWLGLGAMFFTGIMNPMANGPLIAVLQAVVEPGMQGRVLTLIQSASVAMSPLSLAVAGPVADLLGVRVWYVVGGVACVLMGVAGFFIPAIVHLEDNHKERKVESVAAGEAVTVYAEIE